METGHPIRRCAFACLLALASCLACAGASAQERGVRLIVGFAPGGVPDVMARMVADRLRGSLAPTVLVENKPGAAGRIAIEQVKGAAPDGNTLLVTPNPMITLYPLVYRQLSYDPGHDLSPIAMLGAFPLVMAIGPMVPDDVRSVTSLAAWLKANPKQTSFGSSATGSTLHFIGIVFGQKIGVPLNHVGYKGGVPAVQDLIGGQIPLVVVTPTAVRPQVAAGRARAMAITGVRRSAVFPDVPTFKEAGFDGLEMQDWVGVFAPARTPSDRIAAIAGAIGDALRTPEIREGFAKLLAEAAPMTPAEFDAAIRAETRMWAPIVKASGFVAED